MVGSHVLFHLLSTGCEEVWSLFILDAVVSGETVDCCRPAVEQRVYIQCWIAQFSTRRVWKHRKMN